ncbi:MAG: hypothetical protein HOJ79_13480 [Nitrospina sp.]|nr:hypothetical protein [Nitrospina sp.]
MKHIVCILVTILLLHSNLDFSEASDSSGRRGLSKIIEEIDELKLKNQNLEKEIYSIKKHEKYKEPPIAIGGSLWLNYAYKDWDSGSRKKGGDFNFDLFRLDVNGSIENFILSAQYRHYSFMDVIHHGWVGYKFEDGLMAKVGVFQVPFGIAPYATHSYWFGMPYYMGLGDDYDAGFGLEKKEGPWKMDLAFFKNGEYGDASRVNRFSVDLVKALGQNNEETNQVSGRLAYTYKPGYDKKIVVGGSGQWGQVFNSDTNSKGEQWSLAGHANVNWDGMRLMLEAIRYEYHPDNPSGTGPETVVLGGLASSYEVAAEGNIFVANIGYVPDLSFGAIRSILIYNDFSILVKDRDNFENSHLNTMGVNLDMGPVYVYLNVIMGKNQVFLGAPASAMAAGDPNEGWRTRFNVNVEFFF